jgi:hypothetical protein
MNKEEQTAINELKNSVLKQNIVVNELVEDAVRVILNKFSSCKSDQLEISKKELDILLEIVSSLNKLKEDSTVMLKYFRSSEFRTSMLLLLIALSLIIHTVSQIFFKGVH